MKEGQCQLCFVGLIIVCFSSLYFAFKKTLFEMVCIRLHMIKSLLQTMLLLMNEFYCWSCAMGV